MTASTIAADAHAADAAALRQLAEGVREYAALARAVVMHMPEGGEGLHSFCQVLLDAAGDADASADDCEQAAAHYRSPSP